MMSFRLRKYWDLPKTRNLKSECLTFVSVLIIYVCEVINTKMLKLLSWRV